MLFTLLIGVAGLAWLSLAGVFMELALVGSVRASRALRTGLSGMVPAMRAFGRYTSARQHFEHREYEESRRLLETTISLIRGRNGVTTIYRLSVYLPCCDLLARTERGLGDRSRALEALRDAREVWDAFTDGPTLFPKAPLRVWRHRFDALIGELS